MKRTSLVKRKSIVADGIPNRQLIVLSQRMEYFKNRTGEKSIFIPADVFLIYVASELFNFFPFRNVAGVINDIVKNYSNLWNLLEKNPKQYLVVELRDLDFVPEIPLAEYIVFPLLIETFKYFDWENRREMVLLNLEKIHTRVTGLFNREGLEIGQWVGQWESDQHD